MSSQTSLFDAVAAQEGREQGIRQVLQHADSDWRRQVERTVLALAKCGDPFTTDDVRHSSVVHQREAGCTLEAVRDFHGHSNISITDRYSHLSPEHLRLEIGKADPGRPAAVR